MKKLFITGGLGYIGTKLAEKALQEGYSVLLYDSLLYNQDAPKLLEILGQSKTGEATLTFVEGDTRDIQLLRESVEKYKPDFFFHFAELVGVYACNQNPERTREINFEASKKVIDVVEALKVPLIYNSTSSVYGNQALPGLLKEDVPLPEPTDEYCKNKLLMEEYIREKREKNPEFKVIVFRPATICGVSPRMRIELLPNHFTYAAVDKGCIKISEPHAYRAEMDIEEMVRAYMNVLQADAWPSLVYNLGHYNLSKIEVAEMIASMIPCRIDTVGNMGDTRNLQIDSSLFYTDFSFSPQKPFETSIQELIEWSKAHLKTLRETQYAGVLNSPLSEWLRLIGD